LKARLLALALLAFFALPTRISAEPSNDKDNRIQACRVLHQEDPGVSIVECLGFLQSVYPSPETGWTPPFCRALVYYEPEFFYSLYVSVADCVARNA
jgi:hypothetical protein